MTQVQKGQGDQVHFIMVKVVSFHGRALLLHLDLLLVVFNFYWLIKSEDCLARKLGTDSRC